MEASLYQILQMCGESQQLFVTLSDLSLVLDQPTHLFVQDTAYFLQAAYIHDQCSHLYPFTPHYFFFFFFFSFLKIIIIIKCGGFTAAFYFSSSLGDFFFLTNITSDFMPGEERPYDRDGLSAAPELEAKL